jgi:GMP synthase (glutamine-hydrolysing)
VEKDVSMLLQEPIFPIILRMEKILIIDFGSQYTQLIARRVRELNIYCEIHPFHHFPSPDADTKGVIFSGSPFSVYDPNFPDVDLENILGKLPCLQCVTGHN